MESPIKSLISVHLSVSLAVCVSALPSVQYFSQVWLVSFSDFWHGDI